MSFFDEVKHDIGISDMRLLNGYSYVNFCGETLYVEGIVKLEKITADCIVVRTKTASIEIVGELNADCITERTLVVSGRIDSVSTRRLR